MQRDLIQSVMRLRERSAQLVTGLEDVVLRVAAELDAGRIVSAQELARDAADGIAQRRKI